MREGLVGGNGMKMGKNCQEEMSERSQGRLPGKPEPLLLLPGSAKSCVTLLSERPSPEPRDPSCTQPCAQPSEPGAGPPDSKSHSYHEVSFLGNAGVHSPPALSRQFTRQERTGTAGHPRWPRTSGLILPTLSHSSLPQSIPPAS